MLGHANAPWATIESAQPGHAIVLLDGKPSLVFIKLARLGLTLQCF